MILGYNTNGLAHHSAHDALRVVAGIGYRAVGVTLDHGVLNPLEDALDERCEAYRDWLAELNLTPVVETGARYLLDFKRKHEPTLISPHGVERRLAFYRGAVDVATKIGAKVVSLWSGVRHDDAPDDEVWARLVAGVTEVLAHASARGVTIAFEPEPGMFIDTLAKYDELRSRLRIVDADRLKLTIDIGHLHVTGETPIADRIRRYADALVNVHLEDMRADRHEHLMFGEGELDFPPIIAALKEIHYTGPACVELSRHSHEGPEAAQRAFEFLSPLIGDV